MAFTDEQNEIVKRAKLIVSTYENMAELIRLGAYKKGSDPDVDIALKLYPQIETFLTQNKEERSSIDASFAALAEIVELEYTPENTFE